MAEPVVTPAETPPPSSVLVVDDEPANLAALEVVLAPLGHRVELARSGRDALRALLHEDFAAVLLDVRMPDMDGFETAELIRSRPSTQSTPIIFITAFPHAEQDLQRAYRVGAADVIFKPFVPNSCGRSSPCSSSCTSSSAPSASSWCRPRSRAEPNQNS